MHSNRALIDQMTQTDQMKIVDTIIERRLPSGSRWQHRYLAPASVPCSRVRTPSLAPAGAYRCLYTALAALAAAPRGSDTPRRPPPPLGAGHGGYARTGSDE